MKRIISLCLVLLCYEIYAQDFIIKRDSTRITAKVLEISTNDVRYRLYDESEGPIYVLRKHEVLSIIHESGREEIFTVSNSLVPGLKYKELKQFYNPKEYSASLYGQSPGWVGFASFWVAGLGECIYNEWGRGLCKFIPCYALNIAGGVFLYEEIYGASIACYAVSLGLNIWSIVDATRIAKVKNMYKSDLRKQYTIDFYPSLDYIKSGNQLQPTAGFTLAMKF